ncbi:MAG: ImmA/IrrE family metallo-endopeptidase [Thermoproteota archaeon]
MIFSKKPSLKTRKSLIINPNLHPYKKRHLIAHTLAHHLFHRNMRANYFLDEKDDRFNAYKVRKREGEAFSFAMYLLIPEEKLDEILKQEWVKESSDPIPELAEEFQISENFMRKRLEFKKRVS